MTDDQNKLEYTGESKKKVGALRHPSTMIQKFGSVPEYVLYDTEEDALASGYSKDDLAQFRQLQDTFAALDTDQSGFLEHKEIHDFLAKTLNREPAEGEVECMIGELDKNQDGKISFNEILELIESRDVLEKKNLPTSVKIDLKKADKRELTILIIPSTGNCGYLIANALAKVPNFKIRCGIRSGQSHEGILSLLRKHAKSWNGTNGNPDDKFELVECDQNSAESLQAALQGVHRVLTYVPTNRFSKWFEWTTNVGKAAKAVGSVEAVYWISGQNLSLDPSLVSSQEEQRVVDAMVLGEECGKIPLVEIRPNSILSNLYAMREMIMKEGKMMLPFQPSAPVAMVHPTDVAQLTASLMALPKEEITYKPHTIYDVHGPKVDTYDNVAKMLSWAIAEEERRGRKRMSYRSNLIAAFNEADTNGDGILSLEELTVCLEGRGYSFEQTVEIFCRVSRDNDSGLTQDEFVDQLSDYFENKEEAPIAAFAMPDEQFAGFATTVLGMNPRDLELLLSVFSLIEKGEGGEAALTMKENFVAICGREPLGAEDWVRENVGAFMPSHWDLVKTHAREDLCCKTAYV